MEKYQTEVLTVRTERSEVRTKKTEVCYVYIQTEQARLINRLLYDFLLPVIYPYVYGNYRKYPTVFGKLLKCLKTVSYSFLNF